MRICGRTGTLAVTGQRIRSCAHTPADISAQIIIAVWTMLRGTWKLNSPPAMH